MVDGGNVVDLLGFAETHPTFRRKPLVAVTSYVCLACRELYEGRAVPLPLPLGCVEAVVA